ncbi:MAG: hypothetical protein AB1733_07805 [Thermodesulfobacteriota bacterium]
MFSELVNTRDAAFILDLKETELAEIVASDQVRPASSDRNGDLFLVRDLAMLKLARIIESLGVDRAKALRYSEAVLAQRLSTHDKNALDWVENETQELFCLISDGQLARIFLRNKEDSKEMDVGAVKPVLLPTTRSEVNVFRAIRPVLLRAIQVLSQ